jgi:hypothetical protein
MGSLASSCAFKFLDEIGHANLQGIADFNQVGQIKPPLSKLVFAHESLASAEFLRKFHLADLGIQADTPQQIKQDLLVALTLSRSFGSPLLHALEA